jgi:uncharacterized protein (DUF427 family)
MAEHIHIRQAEGTWTVRAGGAILGETTRALELTEGRYPPVIYFPREDIAMAFLDKSDRASTCPHKGEAEYFTIVAKSGPITDAAWSYPDPKPEAAAIAGHLAFYPDKATIERI